MTNDRRQFFLKVGVAVAVGLFLLDSFVIEPAIGGWNQQSIRITALKEKVNQGRQLRKSEATLRERWAAMLQANLPAENSAAEDAARKAVDRWVRDSQIILTNANTPPWQSKDDGFEILEFRITGTGTQAALSRFLYEVESDRSVPVNIEEFEIASRDGRGAQLTLTVRLSFLRIKESPKRNTP